MRSYPQEMFAERPRVRFSETSQMVLVTKLSDGPYKNDIWFTEDELDDFKANMTAYIGAVRLHIAHRRAPTASHILGMEKFLTVQLTEEYKLRRGRLTREVLNEARWQRAMAARGRQRLDGKAADVLAKIATEHSKWARERARAAALFLEQDQEAEKKLDLDNQARNDAQAPAQARGNFQLSAAESDTQWNHRISLREPKRSRMTPSSSQSDHGSRSKHIRTVTPIENASPAKFRRTVSPSHIHC